MGGMHGLVTAPVLLSATASSGFVDVTFAHSHGGEPYVSGGKSGFAYRLFVDGSKVGSDIKVYMEHIDSGNWESASASFPVDVLVYGDVSLGAVDSKGNASPLSNSMFASNVPAGTGVFVRGCKALSFECCEFEGMDTVLMSRESSVSVSTSLMMPESGGVYYDFDDDSTCVEFGNNYRRP